MIIESNILMSFLQKCDTIFMGDYMEEKLAILLEKINLDSETKELFFNSKLSHITKKKDNSKCLFEIEIDKPINYGNFLKVLNALTDTFSTFDQIALNFILKKYTSKELEEQTKLVMQSILNEKQMLTNYLENPLKTDEHLICLTVGNIIEEKQATNLMNEVITILHLLGFKCNYEIKVERSLNEKISEEIKADLTRKVNISEKEEKPVVEEVKRPNFRKRIFKVDDERVVMGNVIENSAVTILKTVPVDINEMGALEKLKNLEEAIVEAKVFGIEVIESRKKPGFRIATLKITDNTDSIYAKAFIDGDENFASFAKNVKEGKWYKFRGSIKYDEYAKEITFSLTDINFFDKKEDKRVDTAPIKRVELHAHTMMSQMDGVTKFDLDKHTSELVSNAIKFGYRGVAITDHGGCQAFPICYEIIKNYNKGKPKEEHFKGIYGTELTLVDDSADITFRAKDDDLRNTTYVVFDTETTGFNAGGKDQMIEIGAVKIANGEIIDRFDEFINPGRPLPQKIVDLTCITDDDLAGADTEENVTKRFLEWANGLPMVAHNAKFDMSFVDMACKKYGLPEFSNTVIDT